jgi:hypothetical protein
MINGCGKIYYGKKNYICDEKREKFDTTEWIAVVWVPLFPIGSYTIVREKRKDTISAMAFNMIWSENIIIEGKRPLDKEQIIKTYLKAYIPIVLVFLLLE